MARSKKNRFTLKILLSYFILALLTGTVGFFIYSEIDNYFSEENATNNDMKLLRTGSLLTGLYEAESLSKLALQAKTKESFTEYENKIDSLLGTIDSIKEHTQQQRQNALLDSIQVLLTERVANTNELRKIKLRSDSNNSLDEALRDFRKLEASLGKITPEALAPNFENLSPKARQVISDIADYLNENVPEKDQQRLNRKQLDSVLAISKALITEAKISESRSQQSLRLKEQEILRNDLALSQQLKEIVSAIEEEVLMNSLYDSRQREEALRQSFRIAVIATALGLAIVILFTFLIHRDYWQVQNYRSQLETQKSITESLLRSREQLISTVGHDLRTPLNAISGYSELMEATPLSPKQKSYMDHMQSAASYVDRLVNDLLDFSKLSAGKLKIDNVPFSLPALIRETAENLEKIHARKKNISLVIEIDPELNKAVISDPLRIRQILTNLIGNAFKFTREGSIKIKAEAKEKKGDTLKVIIKVRDTGIGIPREKQQIIFQEFQQADEDVEKTYGGYGLGLTISKKLTDLLGGNIRLRSQEGKGSTFILELPLQVSPEPLQIASKPDNNDTELKAILIVDDDPAMLQLLEEMCNSHKIQAITYSNFNSLDPNASLDYQMVLTDIQMPHTDGFEVLRQLKSGKYRHYIQQPVIAMTGRRDMDENIYQRKGFSEVLKKPFKKNQLIEVLYRLIPSEKLRVGENEVEDIPAHSHELFSLETLYSFLGDDEEAVAGILRTFREETEINMAHLLSSSSKGEYEKVNRLAHRMLPMFRQFRAVSCIGPLEILETVRPHEMPANKMWALCKDLKGDVKALLEAQLPYLRLTSPNRSG